MKIYTKKGDNGTTQLFSGERVSKGDLRLEAYGTIDELNSFLSLARSFSKNEEIERKIKKIQKELFYISSDFASKKHEKTFIKEEDISILEREIDEMNEKVPKLKNFIYPGGSIVSSHLQVSRTICRRAERLAVKLLERDEKLKIQVKFLNRLSDYLFILARYNNFLEGIKEEEVNFNE